MIKTITASILNKYINLFFIPVCWLSSCLVFRSLFTCIVIITVLRLRCCLLPLLIIFYIWLSVTLFCFSMSFLVIHFISWSLNNTYSHFVVSIYFSRWFFHWLLSLHEVFILHIDSWTHILLFNSFHWCSCRILNIFDFIVGSLFQIIVVHWWLFIGWTFLLYCASSFFYITLLTILWHFINTIALTSEILPESYLTRQLILISEKLIRHFKIYYK